MAVNLALFRSRCQNEALWNTDSHRYRYFYSIFVALSSYITIEHCSTSFWVV